MKYFRKNSTTCLCFGPRKLEIFWTTGIVVGFLLGKLLGRGIWDVLWVSSTSPTPYESHEQVSNHLLHLDEHISPFMAHP